jgi:uncharacterized protein (DUF58 family)
VVLAGLSGWLGAVTARLRRTQRRESARTVLPGAALLDAGFLAQLETLSLAARGAPTGGLIGEHASRRKASSIEFADYRGYVPGDDFRLIDWNVYARLGELCLKLTQARENVTLHLLLDASQSMDWGEPTKFLVARRLAAALGVVSLASYDSVSLTVLRDGGVQRFPLLRGKASIARLVGHLGALEAGGATDLRQSAIEFCSARGRGGVGIVLSDLWVDSGWDDALLYLQRGGLQTTLLHVLDPQELEPQVEGALELVDCESGRPLSVVISPALLARYRAALAARMDAVSSLCASLRIGYVPVRTTDPLETVMLQDLRRIAVVR